jgi:hypothetical protein
MDFGALAKRAGKIARDNSPAILTAIGVTGVVTTAYLTGKATFKAAEILRDAEEIRKTEFEEDELSFQNKFELVWKLYIPAAGSALMTATAIICANRIGNRRVAALISAYNISEKAFEEYRSKVLEKMGPKREQTVKDEIAQDRVTENPVSKSQLVVIQNGGTTLCMDLHSGRYFNSDMETIRKAVNDLNAQVINETYASLTDFWDRIGLPRTSESDYIGWSTDKLLEVDYSATLDEHNKPCMTIGFRTTPIRGYASSY